MKLSIWVFFLAVLALPADAAAHGARGAGNVGTMPDAVSAAMAAQTTAVTNDSDQTLHAMHDEMDRARTRLQLPDADKPFFVQYRLLDLDVRTVTASFGALISSSTSRTRFMSVDVRVGDYHLDSSNFLSADGFQGFLGSTGEVGIDRDYNSLRQDLWLATDQAYKAAVTQMSLKQAFLRSLTKPPEIDDFAQSSPIIQIEPHAEPDWTSRKWEDEARAASVALKDYPQLYGTRVTYYIVYATTYLMTSEGTTMRTSTSLASIEAALDTQADDGLPLHDFYSVYTAKPGDLPDSAAVSKALTQAATDLLVFRASPLVSDYTGPVLFDPPAAASLLAQVVEPSLSGARPPLSATQDYDSFMDRVGGRNEWTGRVGTRVLPATVTLTDDPTATQFQGQPLLGAYDIDDEGVKAQPVTIVENGMLRNMLMSRRPGPDFQISNGHARSSMLSDPYPLSSNLFFKASDAVSPADLRAKFLATCKDNGQQWCIEVKRMDNPALSALRQQDFGDFMSQLGGDIESGARLPLELYRVYVSDGHEEPVREGVIEGLSIRSLRNILGVGNDAAVYTYMQQNSADGLAGTALGSFGSAQGGIPSTVVAPSLLLDEIEIRGFHGEPRRLPLVSPPPLK
ncbi:MAG TPA: metallopeptidase TldD-related protein [Candidatus Acidoferrales bacterium]|jgi:predicted Zn-dependent protease|nr:metallopeptidase TldD-related protein [Candidatus Acidoferrales bacterium]